MNGDRHDRGSERGDEKKSLLWQPTDHFERDEMTVGNLFIAYDGE